MSHEKVLATPRGLRLLVRARSHGVNLVCALLAGLAIWACDGSQTDAAEAKVAPLTPATGFGALGGRTNGFLESGIADDDEMPRLHVRAARRRACCLHTCFDHLSGNGPSAEMARGTSPLHFGRERTAAREHLWHRVFRVRWKRN